MIYNAIEDPSPVELSEDEVFVFPASYAQQRLWFLDQLEPGSPFYNIPSAVRLKGKLDVEALERSLNEIARRHETLRTIFEAKNDGPVQMIAPARSIALPIVDLSDVPETEREARLQELANEEAQRPFNLTTGPLFRARLLRLADDDHVALLTLHHIISDGWSMGVLIREIAILYEAFSTGKPSPLPDLTIQYADYSEWQRGWLQGEVLESQLDYWKKQLGGKLPALELPADRPRPAVQTSRGATLSIDLLKPLTESLKALARQEGATLFMILLAAFQTLLHRYTGQEDICVGTPIANRTRGEIEGLIGLFINTLVMRTDFSGEPTFRELLRRAREVTLDAYAHQDVPFEMVVEALHPERDTSYNPLFQVMFILQNAGGRAHELPGLTLSLIEPETKTATFDLTISTAETAAGMSVAVEYNTDLFEAATIKRVLGHYQTLLESVVATPDQSIATLNLLTSAERRQLLEEWNNTFKVFPQADSCIQQLFEAQVERIPEGVAVVWPAPDQPAQRLTYRELNQRANQLAHYLKKLGVGPEVRVGICLERSLEMAVGVMGVLKAGGAYLPIDPAYPAERIGYMLEDSQVRALLTQAGLAAQLPAHHAQTVCLDSDWPAIAQSPVTNPQLPITPDNLAYVIYTSGTTGKPKGTMIEHRNLVNAYLAWEEAYQLRAMKTHLQMANFAFDVFSGDFVRALCSGGTLVLCPRDYLLAPEKLYALLTQEKIECAEFVPAVLRPLIEYLEKAQQNLAFMRNLICGSDIWYMGEYKNCLKYCGPDTRLIDSFGLTEATIDSSYFEKCESPLSDERAVPIGRPFANTQLYILDKHLQPLPIGVTGDLYVGGAGLARGYLDRPELTAEKFIEVNSEHAERSVNGVHRSLFTDSPTIRLYKTGDLARYLPDGNVELLGRLDYQVKVRGFRIEVGEIENVLKQHLAVREAVVSASAGGGGSSAQRLVAYLVSDMAMDRVPLQSRCLAREDYTSRPFELNTFDLSPSGLGLMNLPTAWSVGQDLHLNLQLPGVTNEFAATGTVAWRREADAGILFAPDFAHHSMLRQSVKHLMAQQGFSLADLRQSDPRLPWRSPCFVEFDDGRAREIAAENLSRGGVRLAAADDIWVEGQSLRLRLPLPGMPEERWLKGQVWWRREGRAGIKFEATTDERELLNQALESMIRSQGLSLSDLRSFLKAKLPDYMVPSAFVMLDTVPLTPNGKVDRKALPAPDWSQSGLEESYVPPRTPVEEMLAGIWMQVLAVDAERVGIHDNFFELGGHSLLATQVVSRVRDAFNVDLPLRRLFETPTIAALAEGIEIAKRQEAGVETQPICPAPRDGILPLSFAQQRLWFLDQLEPNSPFYNLPEALRLTGPLDVTVLEQSLNEIARRHEVLRTTFVTVDGKPQQVIAPAGEVAIAAPVIDLRDLPEAEREAEAIRLAAVEAQTPFDLAHGPLLRARLLRLADDDHVVLLTMHHIIGDEWSSNVMTQEIAILYNAFSAGTPSPLPDLPIQYADFAAWQRSWLQGEVLAAQLAYWKEQLGGSPPLLHLPTDRPRPAVQTYRGAYQSFELPVSLSKALAALSRREGATLFMTLLAAFQVLLSRYTHQDDINVGTPIANRNRADIEALIGFFVNTLVMRARLDGQPGFREVLKRVREAALGAYAHQDLPFEMIVDALQPERDLSHSPLFQAMFVTQNAPQRAGQQLPGLAFSPFEAHSGTAKFDLTLFMLEDPDHLRGAFEYNTDLFDGATVTRLIGHFQTLLEGIVANPDQPIATLPILTEAEKHQLLVEWNDTAADFPRHLCVHHLFEEQAERTPDAIAVRFKDEMLTYCELNCRANRLAYHLQTLGVKPETLVGICAERSPEMVVGLLGILKAGGAYVPLDPAYPPERLAFMLEDSQAPILLTQKKLLERLPPHHAQTVLLDDPAPHANDDNPVSNVSPENLAYIIYTSGSTGQPKGVMILHRGVVNYLAWCKMAYPVEEGTGAPVHSSISFDLTVTSLFAPLACGRCVHLLPEDLAIETLAGALRHNTDYSLIKITPAHLQVLGEQLAAHDVAGRTRSFVIGGENLLEEHIAFWQKHAPDSILINEYGPTETVVGCCVYQAPKGARFAGSVPIGRPIINTQLYVLDKYLQPVPVGVMGELYVGGEGLGRGYLNRPELTAERFVEIRELENAPMLQSPRLYKTGDLVRYLPDGNLEYMCRVDFQVKIRGFRVELGEIEAALSQHPAVKEVAAWMHDNKRLTAYVVPNGEVNTADLREFLQGKLPDYMIPSAFVTLDALPLTSNGKVDRTALPAPDLTCPKAGSFIAPRSKAEEVLAAIWAQVLNVKQVGVHDNFFELGGDSILSIQVISRANQAGLHLTPKQLFEHPTVAGLAAAARAASPVNAEQGLVTGPVPLTPIQHWFFEHGLPEPHHWNQSLMLTVEQHLDRATLEAAIQHLHAHHDALRLRFEQAEQRPPSAQGWQQFNAPPHSDAPLIWLDLSVLPEAERVIAIESTAAVLQASLNLAQGSLLRAAYFDWGDGRPGRLLLVIHHLAMDGISWRILLEDFQAIYEQLSQGQAPQLPLKTTAFRDWARRLVEHAGSEQVREELNYWLTLAEGCETHLPLESNGENAEASAQSVTVGLTVEETEALLQGVPQAHHTEINDALLAALAKALTQWTGAPAVLVDLEGHGREHIADDVDVSRTVGWFTTIYPVRLNAPTGKPDQALQAMKNELRRIPGHGLSYGLLRYLGDGPIREQLRTLPQAEVSFNYLGQMDGAMGESESFAPAPESRGPEHSPRGKRTHLIDINGGVVGGQLQMEWAFSANLHRQETVERVANDFVAALREIIACCQSPEAEESAPPGVEEFDWDDDLGEIVDAIEKSLG